MITPALQGEEFVEDVKGVDATSGQLQLWWLGQSGYLLHWRGEYLLIDPYLSDSLTEKYAGTEKPHVRMTELVIEPERLDFVRVVSSSHNHTDHLDAATLKPLLRVNAGISVVVPAANVQFAADRLEVAPERLIAARVGESVGIKPFTYHAVPAAHEQLEKDDEGHYTHVGYVIEAGPWTVYHSGDTVRYEGMTERLNQFDIDVALLPINGTDPERGVPGNLSGPEAAQLGFDIGARMVIPCHYEMFEFNTVSPDEFADAAELLGQPFALLAAGARWSTESLPSHSA
ncbi:MAG: MBL fold metallo-hydrolase [Anaerolineales bacterium]|nr:MBL fold metallo-hydrolase [Anaerolineales bacterium]